MTFLSSFSSPPIGIFDSGVGGLTVLRQVQRLLPQESVLYLGDTANVPYGDKPIAVVRDLALQLTECLIDSGAKLVIMASGTSTVAGLEAALALYPTVPILGTIDVGACTALSVTNGPIGVLATNATVQSLAFTQAIQHLAPGQVVVEQGCPLFVPLVESGRAESSEAVEAAREYLLPLLDAGVNTIILGCTHFPFLLPVLQKVASECPTLSRPIFVDPAEEVVRAASAILAETSRLASAIPASPVVMFAATGDTEDFRLQASRLLGHSLPPVKSLSL